MYANKQKLAECASNFKNLCTRSQSHHTARNSLHGDSVVADHVVEVPQRDLAVRASHRQAGEGGVQLEAGALGGVRGEALLGQQRGTWQ